MPQIIDGKQIAMQIKEELKERVARLNQEGKSVCLAVIQVGNDPASTVYVNGKKKDCAYIGIESRSYEPPEETKEEELRIARSIKSHRRCAWNSCTTSASISYG